MKIAGRTNPACKKESGKESKTMYSEQEKRRAAQRANDDFLRKMLGGELRVGAVPTFEETRPSLPEYPTRPPCNSGETTGGREDSCTFLNVHSPSLAMVYAPRQCWKGVYDPMEALTHGSQFAELVLPFKGYQNGRGGKTCN